MTVKVSSIGFMGLGGYSRVQMDVMISSWTESGITVGLMAALVIEVATEQIWSNRVNYQQSIMREI